MIDEYTKELERALNPREWDQELNDAWHKNIPDLQKAFDDIKDIAIKKARIKMNEQSLRTVSLRTVIDFNKLPETEEIKEIKRQYLNDEISAFEFFSIASRYLEDNKNETHN